MLDIDIQKVKKYRRSKSATTSFVSSSNVSIESAPYSESVSYDPPFRVEGIGVKIPTTIPSTTSEILGRRCRRNRRAGTRRSHKSKCHPYCRITLGESIKMFPLTRYHCVFDEERPTVAYFSDATLYSIPEHGAGLCRAEYSTVYPCTEPDVWSVEQSNDRPHHRRSSVVLS